MTEEERYAEIQRRLTSIERKVTRLDELAMGAIALGAGGVAFLTIYRDWEGGTLLAIIGGVIAFCVVGYFEIRQRR